MARKCVNCGKRSVGEPGVSGFAKCRECGCSNIVPTAADYAAAHKVQRLLSEGWPKRSESKEAGT